MFYVSTEQTVCIFLLLFWPLSVYSDSTNEPMSAVVLSAKLTRNDSVVVVECEVKSDEGGSCVVIYLNGTYLVVREVDKDVYQLEDVPKNATVALFGRSAEGILDNTPVLTIESDGNRQYSGNYYTIHCIQLFYYLKHIHPALYSR